MSPSQITVKRLNYLRDMLTRYSTAYYRAVESGREISDRMYAWIDEYNSARDTPEWSVYCKQHDYDTFHDAGDLFA
jgi:hypothetical protein